MDNIERNESELFLSAIETSAGEHMAALEREENDRIEELKNGAYAEARQRREEYLKSENLKTDMFYDTKAGGTVAGLRRRTAALRNGIADGVFAEAVKRIGEFVSGPEYEERMKKELDRVKALTGGASLSLTVRKADEELFRKLRDEYNISSVTSDGSVTLGGFTARCDEKGVSFDATYDTAIERQREEFCVFSGLSLDTED